MSTTAAATATRGRRDRYHVVTRWHVAATVEELVEIAGEPTALPRWWPAAFLRVTSLPTRRGARFRVHSKGWLPYTLRFDVSVRHEHARRPLVLAVRGDFWGRAVCRAEPDDAGAWIEFDWRVRVRKPVLSRLSWALKPVFVANHRWVMRRGAESLNLELLRRRRLRLGDPRPVAPPSGPTFPYGPASRRLRAWIAWLRRERRLAALGPGGQVDT